MNEFRDPAKVERLEAEHPEEAMRRREFLLKTAALAGAAGLATQLPLEALVSGAAKVQTAAAFPSPRNMPVDNFVVVMMENRSFDHYFGWHPDADGRAAGLTYPDDLGQPHPTHRLAPDFQGCAFEDPDHSWEGGRRQLNGGKVNGFRKSPNDDFALGYYLREDLPFAPHLADTFTLYDRYFCSLLGPDLAQPRVHALRAVGRRQDERRRGRTCSTAYAAGRALPLGDDLGPDDDQGPLGHLLLQRPALHRHLRAVATPGSSSRSPSSTPTPRRATLPNLAFVDPMFLDGGGGDGLSGRRAPARRHADRPGLPLGRRPRLHQLAPVPDRGAVRQLRRVGRILRPRRPPPACPTIAPAATSNENFGVTGFRIPGFAVSPYARRGHVSHMTVTHESILKLISYRFGLGYLNKRHRYASNIGRSFDWENPNFEPPNLPDSGRPGDRCPARAQGFRRAERTRPPPASAEEHEGLHIGSPEMLEYFDRSATRPSRPGRSTIFSSPDATTSRLAPQLRQAGY